MKTILFILSIIFLFSCSAQKKNEEKLKALNVKKWSQFDNQDYSISYPSTWEFDSSGQMGTLFFMRSPSDSETDKFTENVNLIKQTNLKDYDLDKYIQLSTNQIIKLIKNSKIIESKRVKVGKHSYHILKYKGLQNQFDLTFTQYIFFEKEQAFLLTFSKETSKEKAYKSIEHQILKSFKFKLWEENEVDE